MAPTTLVDLPNEMLVAIFIRIADDASATDALSASCSTLHQLWTSSADFILFHALPFYTAARDVALAHDYVETTDVAVVQSYLKESCKHRSSRPRSPFITLESTPEYSHSIAYHPLVPEVCPASQLTPAPVPNVHIPCQIIENKHISLIRKLAQNAQRLCDLVEEDQVSRKLGCLNPTCQSRSPTLLPYERTRIIHAYYLLRLYVLLQSWIPPHQILTARHTLKHHVDIMHPRERRLLQEVMDFTIHGPAFDDLYSVTDPDAVSDDPYATGFAAFNWSAFKRASKDICNNSEFPDDDLCIYCRHTEATFGTEGSIPGEKDWGREKLTSSWLLRESQEPR